MKITTLQNFLAYSALGTAVSLGHRQHQGISKDDFIKVDGLRLYDSKGALHYLTGKLHTWSDLSKC